MRPAFVTVPIAMLLATLAQTGYASKNFLSAVSLLGYPGFMVAMFTGNEGHGGRTSEAPFIEFFANFVFYFFFCWMIAAFLFWIWRRTAKDPDMEKRLYDHR
jgi:hypothetical protein